MTECRKSRNPILIMSTAIVEGRKRENAVYVWAFDNSIQPASGRHKYVHGTPP